MGINGGIFRQSAVSFLPSICRVWSKIWPEDSLAEYFVPTSQNLFNLLHSAVFVFEFCDVTWKSVEIVLVSGKNHFRKLRCFLNIHMCQWIYTPRSHHERAIIDCRSQRLTRLLWRRSALALPSSLLNWSFLLNLNTELTSNPFCQKISIFCSSIFHFKVSKRNNRTPENNFWIVCCKFFKLMFHFFFSNCGVYAWISICHMPSMV